MKHINNLIILTFILTGMTFPCLAEAKSKKAEKAAKVEVKEAEPKQEASNSELKAESPKAKPAKARPVAKKSESTVAASTKKFISIEEVEKITSQLSQQISELQANINSNKQALDQSNTQNIELDDNDVNRVLENANNQATPKSEAQLILDAETQKEQVVAENAANTEVADKLENVANLNTKPIEEPTAVANEIKSPLDLMSGKDNINQLIKAENTPQENVAKNIFDSKSNDYQNLESKKYLIGSAVVLAGILLVSLAYNRKKGKAGRNNLPKQNFKIIQNISVGQKRSVAVIEWNQRTLLVGITENNISLLSSEDHKSEDQVQDSVPFKQQTNLSINEDDGFISHLKRETTRQTSVFENEHLQNHQTVQKQDEGVNQVSQKILSKIGSLKFKQQDSVKEASNKSKIDKYKSSRNNTSSSSNGFVVEYNNEQGFIKG